MRVAEIAYAKLNLALHVRRRREDGYHELETIFAFADDGDRIEVAPSTALELAIVGPFSPGLSREADNLVLRAAHAMQKHFRIKAGASIRLDKRLPIAAGLGGGSADAAAAARALAKLWGIDADERSLVDAIGHLGADVPACIASRTVRGEGVGDRFVEVDADGVTSLPVLVANPRIPLSTANVFAAWNGADQGPLVVGDVMAAMRAGRNDLEAGAVGICPAIAQGLQALSGHAEILCRMSGSGASIFAIYPDEAARHAASVKFAEHQPGWWSMEASLR